MAANKGKTLTYLIHNELFDETYSAQIEKNGTQWVGWIPEYPDIKCEEKSREAVQKQLPIKLHETLVAEEKAWEKQLANDLEKGRLDHLIEKAVENYKAGRYSRIVIENE